MNRRCVIVDDVRAYRVQLSKWLEEWGFECWLADSVPKAWRIVREQRFDLLITDIDLQRSNGFELILAMRSRLATTWNKFSVVTISSLEDARIEEFARQFGSDRFVAKPLDKQRFFSVVNSLFEIACQDGPCEKPVAQTLERKRDGRPKNSISPALRRIVHDLNGPGLPR